MFKLALSAGHGKYTAGKRCPAYLDAAETREWVLNSRICEKLEKKLSGYAVSVLRLDDREGKRDVPLRERTDNANRFGADLYLSIHHNAGIAGGEGGGIVAYVYTDVDEKTLAYQREFYKKTVEKTALKGNRATPLAKKDLWELRKSSMPAVLLECGFMDSATDINYILSEEFAEGIADACAEVVIAHTGGAPATAPTPAAPTPEAQYFKKYDGGTVSIVMALKSIGEDSSYAMRRKIAAANKIENYSGTAEQNLYLLSLLKKGELLKP